MNACPECGTTEIVLKTIGTKALVDEVQRLFPAARIQRFDADVEKSDQLESHLTRIQEGAVDIIIGTQMITKGLDLPNLSVVGIINADAGLMLPDFSASERSYQLIAQVVGRVGRGHRAGHVILQTYQPNHPVLAQALAQNYADFYETEINERRTYDFPPFCFMVRLTCLRTSSASAEKAALKLKAQLEERSTAVKRIRIEGPSPAFHPRESGKYKWQLIVKSRSRHTLLDVISTLPSGWQHNIDPTNLL